MPSSEPNLRQGRTSLMGSYLSTQRLPSSTIFSAWAATACFCFPLVLELVGWLVVWLKPRSKAGGRES